MLAAYRFLPVLGAEVPYGFCHGEMETSSNLRMVAQTSTVWLCFGVRELVKWCYVLYLTVPLFHYRQE